MVREASGSNGGEGVVELDRAVDTGGGIGAFEVEPSLQSLTRPHIIFP